MDMSIRTLAVGLGALLLSPALPAAGLTVRFVAPEHYTDAGNYAYDTERTLRTLERHLAKLGDRCLAEGEKLELQVLDIDLAGRREWRRGPGYDLRVMREITWPWLELAYVWRDGAGQVLGEGRERVSDQNYLWRSAYVSGSSDELPYEKAMLRDWFERRFCRQEAEAAARMRTQGFGLQVGLSVANNFQSIH
jgi:hypothetical protein